MSKTILIVDDSSVIRASLKFSLAGAGYEVVERPNGKDGLAALDLLAAQGKRPAMIISDINMPIMDGMTFINNVKKGVHRFVPILILTTESQATKIKEGKNAGAAGWLVKPFDEAQLLAVVRKLVR